MEEKISGTKLFLSALTTEEIAKFVTYQNEAIEGLTKNNGDFVAAYHRLQARLTATYAALYAAGELLRMSSMGDVYSDDGGYIYCSSCSKVYPHHKRNCEYQQAKARWDAARAALKKVTK